MNRLALGTAQFGSDYGITNRSGQIDADEARRILTLARECGIDCVDTARLYGDCEAVIGSHRDLACHFRIVTKTRTFDGIEDGRGALMESFAASLQALRRDRIFGLLMHDARDLLGPLGPELWSTLEALKASGQVEKIGVSVYGAEQVDGVLSRYPIDIVQLPFNALDRRLVDGGQLEALSRTGVEVHARSIFLQGLLLARAEDLPPQFATLRPALQRLDETFARKGLTRLEGLIACAFARKEIGRAVIGVTSADELRAIVEAAGRAASAEPMDEDDLPQVDARFLDPPRWSELQSTDE